MKNVSRDRCCQLVKAGGLNVINFNVECSCLHFLVFLVLGMSSDVASGII